MKTRAVALSDDDVALICLAPQFPLVHLNGTSRASLLEQYDQARRAVSGARRVVEAVSPNLRDYYPLPDGEAAYKRALAEHLSRVERLVAVAEELGAICEHLEDT